MLKIEKATGVRPVLFDWVDNLFGRDDDLFPGFSFFNKTTPSVNILETQMEFKLEVCVPGMKKEDFMVTIDNGVLFIKAELEEEKVDEGKLWTRREFNFRNFKRSFMLPENVMTEKILAKYLDGILIVTLPKVKTELKHVKEIPIKAS